MKMLLSDLSEKLRANKLPLILICTLLFFLMIITTLPRIKEFQDFSFNNSIADGFVIANHIYIVGFFTIPCSLLITMTLFKNDFRQNYLIRQQNRTRLWHKQLIQTAILNIPYTLFITGAIILINQLFTKDWINWNQEGSVYFAANLTTSNISFTQVMLTYIANTYLLLMLMNLLFQALYWLTNNYQLSWLLYICIFVWDMDMDKTINIIFKKLLMDYKYWLKYPANLDNTLGFALLFLGLLLALGNHFKRKEFLND